MSDDIRGENTVLVMSCAWTEYAIDVNPDFRDVTLLRRGPDGTMWDIGGWAYSDDAGKAAAVAGALLEIARLTRKEQEAQND